MMPRMLGSLVAVLLSTAVPSAVFHQVLAQQTPGLPLPAPLGDMLSDPSTWLVRTFDGVLDLVGRRAIRDILDLVGWLLNSGSVINQTPPALTYQSEVVQQLWQRVVICADAGLGAVVVWAGINVMIRPHLRAPYQGALEVLPRIVLCAVLVNTSLYWGQFVIDLNNALCGVLGASGMPAWDSASELPSDSNILLNLVAVGIYLIMGLLLFVQMLMRIALLDALLIVGPLAVLCWALPQTYGWARLWFSTFFATVFVQFVQVLVLRLGTELITHLPSVFGTGADLDSGRLWLVTLLLGVAVLQLARKIPRLMPGYASGSMLTQDSPMALVRSVRQLMPGGQGGSGRR
jgi:hypothetical protein